MPDCRCILWLLLLIPWLGAGADLQAQTPDAAEGANAGAAAARDAARAEFLLEEQRALAACFQGATQLDPASGKLSYDHGLRLFGNSPLVSLSRSAPGSASDLIRRVTRGMRLDPPKGEAVWASLNASLQQARLEMTFSGSGTASIKLHDGRDVPEASIFVRGSDTGFRITEVRRGRERTLSRTDFTDPISGGYTIVVQCEARQLTVSSPAAGEKPALVHALAWEHGSCLALGAQDGPITITSLRCVLTVDAAWWKTMREWALAHAALMDFQRNGAHALFRDLVIALSNDRVSACLAAYGPEHLALRDRGAFEEVAGLLPDNELARFEAARALADQGALALALAHLERIAQPSDATQCLAVLLELRTFATKRAGERLQGMQASAHRALLRGIVAIRQGAFAQAKAEFEASTHPLARNLARSADRLMQFKVAKSGLLVHAEGASDELRAVVQAEVDRYAAAYMRFLGLEHCEAVDIRLFGRGADFLACALPYAHEHIDELGALFIAADDATSSRIMLCAAVGKETLLVNLRHELWHACLHMAKDKGAVFSPALEEGAALLFSAALPRESLDKEAQNIRGSWAISLPLELQGLIPEIAAALGAKDAPATVRALLQASADEFYRRARTHNGDARAGDHAQNGGNDAYALAWAIVWAQVEAKASTGSLEASSTNMRKTLMATHDALCAMNDEALATWSAQAAQRLLDTFGS